MQECYDLAIIGAGPAGAAAAIYASRAALKTIWLEGSFSAGGQILESSLVDNYPGLLSVSGTQLGEAFRLHAEALGMIPERCRVQAIEKREDGLFYLTSKKQTVVSRAVIYAAGASHQKLGIPGEEEYAGSGVSYCATCDGAFFKDRTVAVIGGGNTACEEALFLSHICEQVFLIHRRDTLRADAALQEQVKKAGNIEIVWNTVPIFIMGSQTVERVILSEQITKESWALKIDGIFVAIGTVPNTELLKGLATLDEKGYVCAGEDTVTSLPGLFAAGDVRQKPLRQVLTAASDGANAAVSAARFLEA